MSRSEPTSAAARAEEQELGRAYLELKRQYDNLVSKNLAGVFRTTVAGRFVECNESMARILGFATRDELMRIPAQELYFDPAERERYVTDLRERQQLVNYGITLKHKSGRPIHVLENVFISEAQEGRPATIEGTLIDISAIKQAEFEQHSLVSNYRQLVEHVRDGILIMQDGTVRYANPAADTLAGRSLAGSHFIEFVHEEDRDKVGDALMALPNTRSAGPLSIRFGLSNGEWKDLVLFASHTIHEGHAAAQLSLQDLGIQQSLLQERMRVRIAEEVNQVLRQEINEHRRTQEALRESKRFARSLVDSSLDMIMAADPQGRISEYNPAASIKFGYEAEEVLGKESSMLYVNASEYERIQEELNAHGAFAGEVQNVSREGKVFTSFLAASRLYDEDGRLIGSMGVSRDITQAKHDQEALVASEERYRDLFENATDLIQSVDVNGTIQYVNTAWKKALGYTDEDLRHLTIWDIVHPEEREHCEKVFAQVLEGAPVPRIITRFISRTGRELHVQGNSSARMVDGVAVASRSVFRDVTGEVEAQEQVHQHEAKLRALFESSEHMFWTVDTRIALTSFNRGYGEMIERLYGTKPEINVAVEKPRKRFASPEYHAFWEDKYAQAFTGKALRFETDLHDKEGNRVCNEIFLSPVFGEGGAVEEVFGVGHEITEQKEAEDLVREQAARLKAIFENSANMMIWTLGRDFRITARNEHFVFSGQRALGIDFELGDAFLEALAPRMTANKHKTLVAKYEAALRGTPQQFEVELKNHAGRSLWVECFLNPITVDGVVTEISCLAYGVTDRKEAQQKLLESLHEKEVLLKEVHHRVKNNLQIISSILNLQSGYVDDDPKMLELIRDSQHRIRSMSFIHESLYQTKNFSSVDLANYIDGLSRNLLMSYSLNGKVDLRTSLEKVELGLDQAIPCGLILNELISNTLKHAFPGGASGRINISVSAEDRHVRITVTDDGVGMPEDFDDEKSGGLGLQLVHTLIGQLDGRIQRTVANSTKGAPGGVAYIITFDRP